ncbi:MAG: hypothetical protein IJB89_05390, partial [Akkermansia sp.]|nr:hypothetical protein [Akkermansia sp.]
ALLACKSFATKSLTTASQRLACLFLRPLFFVHCPSNFHLSNKEVLPETGADYSTACTIIPGMRGIYLHR